MHARHRIYLPGSRSETKLRVNVCVQNWKEKQAFVHNSTNLYPNRSDWINVLFEIHVWGRSWFYLGSDRNNFTIQKKDSATGPNRSPSQKNPWTQRSPPPTCLFILSLCETKYWKRVLSLLNGTLFSRSNLLYRWQEKGEHIHPQPRAPFYISLVSISLCKHRGLEKKKKSIKAYLNEEGRDTMAPSERWVVIREVDEESS